MVAPAAQGAMSVESGDKRYYPLSVILKTSANTNPQSSLANFAKKEVFFAVPKSWARKPKRSSSMLFRLARKRGKSLYS
jgi:hypothetical protein